LVYCTQKKNKKPEKAERPYTNMLPREGEDAKRLVIQVFVLIAKTPTPPTLSQERAKASFSSSSKNTHTPNPLPEEGEDIIQ